MGEEEARMRRSGGFVPDSRPRIRRVPHVDASTATAGLGFQSINRQRCRGIILCGMNDRFFSGTLRTPKRRYISPNVDVLRLKGTLVVKNRMLSSYIYAK